MSTLATGGGIMLVAAAASTVGFLVVSKYVPERWLVADSDAASALYATIGMVYAILVAIAAIAVWEPHDAALQSTQQEAGDLTEAYWSASALDPVDSAHIRVLIVTYAQSVVRDEWPTEQRTHAGNDATAQLFIDLRTAVQEYQPVTDAQQNAVADVLSRLEDAADARRARLAAAADGMPPLLWPTLIIGGIVSIGFLYLFGLDRTFPNGLMMATVAAMTTLVLFVIYQVEFPFSRGLAVGPTAFLTFLTTLGAPT